MKKIIICSLFACLSNYGIAQKEQKAKVPAAAKSAFAAAHPNVTGSWEKEGANYEVSFKEAGKTMSCVIDAKGNITETETAVPVSELPAAAVAYLKSHYKNVKIKETAKIVKQNGETIYEAEVKGKDLLFDTSGKYLKTVKD